MWLLRFITLGSDVLCQLWPELFTRNGGKFGPNLCIFWLKLLSYFSQGPVPSCSQQCRHMQTWHPAHPLQTLRNHTSRRCRMVPENSAWNLNGRWPWCWCESYDHTCNISPHISTYHIHITYAGSLTCKIRVSQLSRPGHQGFLQLQQECRSLLSSLQSSCWAFLSWPRTVGSICKKW